MKIIRNNRSVYRYYFKDTTEKKNNDVIIDADSVEQAKKRGKMKFGIPKSRLKLVQKARHMWR